MHSMSCLNSVDCASESATDICMPRFSSGFETVKKSSHVSMKSICSIVHRVPSVQGRAEQGACSSAGTFTASSSVKRVYIICL